MGPRAKGLAILLAVLLAGAPARAQRWSATLYAGPATNRWVTQILAGNFNTNGGMIGIAADRALWDLGSGIKIGAEAQLTRFDFGVTYDAVSAGLGVRFDELPWSNWLPSTIAIYTGPSLADSSPPIHFGGYMPRLLNYVGLEIGVKIPGTQSDIVFRAFHRSGAFGLYSDSADEGSSLDIGIRRMF